MTIFVPCWRCIDRKKQCCSAAAFSAIEVTNSSKSSVVIAFSSQDSHRQLSSMSLILSADIPPFIFSRCRRRSPHPFLASSLLSSPLLMKRLLAAVRPVVGSFSNRMRHRRGSTRGPSRGGAWRAPPRISSAVSPSFHLLFQSWKTKGFKNQKLE